MSQLLTYITDSICGDDPKYAPTLRAHLGKMDAVFCERAESFFNRYKTYIESTGKTLDFGLECFKTLRASVQEERLEFMRTGGYSNTSFDAVNRRVYSNPEIMVAYMHGLVFAQFLWPEQYRRFSFFCEHLGDYRDGIRSYLEIGGGHGLYIREALQVLRSDTTFQLVDISSSSLELAQGILGEPRVQYHLTDIFKFPDERRYDFITVGEVLEHLERPDELLRKIHALLTPEGHAYITTPANAPMIDHIHLFNDADEIRTMLRQCGFAIEREVTQYAADLPLKRNIALKTALMFGAFVRKA
jgi:2-polyprenyl-3-methyl-5-hydroxy-6-metoxy-1,4-benzoquinol methylase